MADQEEAAQPDPRGPHGAGAALHATVHSLGLYTGRRKEAILSLRWPQVDLEAGRIDFEVAGRRRTNKKRGIIQIPPRLLPHLRRARKRGTDLGYVLHINGERIKDIKKGFAAACERAGLEGVSPHTLRHTAATWLMQAGTDLWQASGFLSMSMETLQRVYGHHHPDYQREAAENIGRRPQNVRVIRGRFRMCSALILHREMRGNTRVSRMNHSSPKAEVTGSNPVGRAST